MRNHTVVAAWHERPIGPPAAVAALARHEKKTGRERGQASRPLRSRRPRRSRDSPRSHWRGSTATGLAELEKAKPPMAEAMAVEDAKGENLRVHLRGNHLTLGAEAPRRFPRVLAGDKPLSLGADRSGRRELAEWLTRPDHPLTARVMVNRVWAGHFGAGLVRSPDNFGRLGERPTHPELLDWLASEFVANGWSVKHLHRLIVTSAAYRMSSRPDPVALLTDPENRLLSHFNRRRLDAEEIRDGMLAVSGQLDRTMGGTLLKATPRQYVTSTANRNYDGYSHPRRSVYLPVVRSAVYDVFQTFDFPDPSVPNGQRTATTIPTQALFMLNSALADQTAEALAKSVLGGGRRRRGPRARSVPPRVRTHSDSRGTRQGTRISEEVRSCGRPEVDARRTAVPGMARAVPGAARVQRVRVRGVSRDAATVSPGTASHVRPGLRLAGAGRPARGGRTRPRSARGRAARPARAAAAALRAEGEARHLPVHARRAVAGRHVRLQAAADRDHGKPLPFAKPRVVSSATGNLLKSPLTFRQHGQSGAWVSASCSRTSAGASTTCASSTRCTARTRGTAARCSNCTPAATRSSGRAWARGSPTAWAPRTRTCPASSPSARR